MTTNENRYLNSPKTKLTKYFEHQKIKINESVVEKSFDEKNSINDICFNKILLFLFFFQKDQNNFLEDFAADFMREKHHDLISPKVYDEFSKKFSTPIGIYFNILAHYNFFSNKLIEFSVETSVNFEIIDVILPVLNYCHYELPNTIYKKILNNEKFVFLEQLKIINSLIKNSKNPKCSCDSINKTKSNVLKHFLQKKINEKQIHDFSQNENKINNIKEFVQQTIFLCLDNNLNKIINVYSKNIRKIFYSDQFLNEILKKNKFDYFNKALKKHKIYPYLSTNDGFPIIFEFLNSQNNFIQGILMLCEIKKMKNLNPQQHLKIILFFENLVLTDKLYDVLLCANPILLLVKLSLLTYILSDLDSPFFKMYKKFAFFFKSCASEMFSLSVSNVDLCKIFLFKVCFPSSEKLIDILFKEKEFFIEILTQEIVLKTIKNSIVPKYQYDYNFLAASTTFSIIRSSHLDYQKQFDLQRENDKLKNLLNKSESKEISSIYSLFSLSENFDNEKYSKLLNIFSFLKTSKLENVKKTNHIYQFDIFVRSIYVRTFFEFLCDMVCFIIIFLKFNYFNEISSKFNHIVDFYKLSSDISDISAIPSFYFNQNSQIFQLSDLLSYFNPIKDSIDYNCVIYLYANFGLIANLDQKKFINDYLNSCVGFTISMNSYYNQENWLTFAVILSLVVGSKFLLNMIFQLKVNKKIKYNKELIVDILITAFSVITLFLKQYYWQFPIDSLGLIVILLRIFCSVVIFLFWLRFLSYFELIQQFAIRIQIIKTMIIDLFSFFVILLFVLCNFFTFRCFFWQF